MSVDPIALGQKALGLGEVPHPAGVARGRWAASLPGRC
jgi:hypothetical protein